MSNRLNVDLKKKLKEAMTEIEKLIARKFLVADKRSAEIVLTFNEMLVISVCLNQEANALMKAATEAKTLNYKANNFEQAAQAQYINRKIRKHMDDLGGLPELKK